MGFLDILKGGSGKPKITITAVNVKLHGNTHGLEGFTATENPFYIEIPFRNKTPGCTIEAKSFNKSLPRFRKSGVEVIGVSNDGISSHRSFRSKCSLKFLLLSDPKSSIIKKYGAYGSRGIFGIGTLRKTFVIDENLKIAKIYEKVRPLGHDREVLSFLAQR